MGTVLAGKVVITTFLLASVLMFGAFLSASVSQGESLRVLTHVSSERLGSALTITSASVVTPAGPDVAVQVDNSGSQSVARFGDLDVILKYTDTDNTAALMYLAYTSGVLGSNQWTIATTGVQPDNFNPGMWDPGETLPIDLRVSPAIKSGTAAEVVVGTPWGVNDKSSVVNP